MAGAAVVALATCGGSSTSTAAAPCRAPRPRVAAPRPGSGATLTITFVDRARGSVDDDDRPVASCRILRTDLRLPAAPGPRPLVLVAHGLDGDPTALRDLVRAWVDAGFVVASPRFPSTPKDDDGRALRSEAVEQAGDLRVVLDRLLAGNARPGTAWSGRIDADRVGAAGMSFGGLAVYALTTNTCCRDPRVRAAVLLAAVYRPLPGGTEEPNRVPVLLEHGDADHGYHNSREAYEVLRAPKWFVTLRGASHASPFEIPRGPERAVVDATTSAFWDRYLLGERDGTDRIIATVREHPGVATLQRDAP